MSVLILSLVILVIILVLTISYKVYTLRRPTCGGTLNPTLRYCDPITSTLVSGRVIPESDCNPISQPQKLEMATQFVNYMKKMNETSSRSMASQLKETFVDAHVYEGSLFFAIPPLLKLLSSDFGQNELTPYGIVSFSDMYLRSCISNPTEFCRGIAKDNALVSVLCQEYLVKMSAQQQDQACPFTVSDGNKNLSIQDVGFFNLIGSLGTFSLQPSQCLLLYYDFPVGHLPLNYWSFNLYLADRLKDEVCAPYRQTYLASLAPPMNCFMTPAIAQKKFNPITGQGDVVEPSHLRFYIMVVLDDVVGDTLTQFVQQKATLPYDFIHVFRVPTGPGSIVLDPDLPNPNTLNPDATFYDPLTDRLSLFMRLSPDPSIHDKETLQKFIYSNDPFKNSCQVCFIDMKDDNMRASKIIKYKQPRYIDPMFDEKSNLRTSFDKTLFSFQSSLYHQNYSYSRLPMRNSVLNIFAPLFSSILSTNRPYLGGWQALQLAGCAQGDNPDTQYRLSGTVCLSSKDIMVSLAINHSKFGNCLYNNINIVDINKAFSVASITLNKEVDVDMYIVIVGRDKNLVNDAIRLLTNMPRSDLTIAFYPVYLKTASSIDNGVPMCHQLLMVERVYINMQYPSISKPNMSYNLKDVFGKDLRGVVDAHDEDRWNSLVGVVAPSVQTLIPPEYYKLSYPSYRPIILQTSFYILVCMFLGILLWKRVQKV